MGTAQEQGVVSVTAGPCGRLQGAYGKKTNKQKNLCFLSNFAVNLKWF